MNVLSTVFRQIQRGVSAIEFAIVLVLLLMLLLGIVEFGRLFFTINSVQEITRRAAREQVVNWVDRKEAVQHVAVLHMTGCTGSGTVNHSHACDTGTVNFPGSPDLTNLYVQLDFLNPAMEPIADSVLNDLTSQQNFDNCFDPENQADYGTCIKFVRATLSQDAAGKVPVDFHVLAPYIPPGVFKLPFSTVVMPAEALGLL